MDYVNSRTNNQRNYDGFDFAVFDGFCQNRTYNDVVTSMNASEYPDASIILNSFSQDQLFMPRSMINPVLSADAFLKIQDLAPFVVKSVFVQSAYSLDCPTGRDLDDFLNPGEDTSILHERLLDKYRVPIPNSDLLELVCIRRPLENEDLCKGSEIVAFPLPDRKSEKQGEIPKALVDHFGIVQFAGIYFRDNVFEAIRDHINEDVFTIQHG